MAVPNQEPNDMIPPTHSWGKEKDSTKADSKRKKQEDEDMIPAPLFSISSDPNLRR
jgi:hypothetical protein